MHFWYCVFSANVYAKTHIFCVSVKRASTQLYVSSADDYFVTLSVRRTQTNLNFDFLNEVFNNSAV